MKDAATDEIFERMLKTIGSVADNALAKALGLSSQAVSEARRKRKIPPAWAITLAEKYQVSLDWLLFGRDPARTGESAGEGAPAAAFTSATCGQCRELLQQNRELLQQLGVANERAYQAGEREKMLLKENAAFQAEAKDLKTRLSLSVAGNGVLPTAKSLSDC